ncbi:hypothetical protein G443_001324 [Actinoalloteichus cyanogriseus DSM 43889]|uniref:Uncharacterized protein n=2 Tax=Actinoalloteichus cyanogriseus TaxID=2893586 RepID=A0ABT1JFJ1_ACTCY|nr:hypothetical protein [Actinoalloteichus caeruleus DSM 43889]
MFGAAGVVIGGGMTAQVDAALGALVRHGFVFRHAQGDRYVPWTLFGQRPRGAYGDYLHVSGPDDCLAARMRTSSQPAPSDVVWCEEGAFLDTVSALLSLPAPDDANAPRLATRRTAALWTPGMPLG